jgi:hypothetical protein
MISMDLGGPGKQFNSWTVSGWMILPKKRRVLMPTAKISFISSREGK